MQPYRESVLRLSILKWEKRVKIDRREFLEQTTGAALVLSAGADATGSKLESLPKKSVLFSMLPPRLGLEERFKLAREVGFEGVEAPPVNNEAEANAMRSAAEKAGIPIHSVIYGGWDFPLSDPNPKVVERGLEETKKAMQSAKWMGAENILLVPAIVTPQVRYKDAYERSQKNIRSLIPTAEKLHIMICIEEVWNKFLLSPLEFCQYVDSFHHPLVQAYFDVGNVLIWAYPEDWIRTLGKRIKKVHLKDFKRDKYQFVNLLEGDVNWKEVRKAFSEIGYTGFLNTELGGGEEAYLRDVASRVDRIITGQ